MKKITSIIALGLALMALSCNKQESGQINEINDHYTIPADAQVMTSVNAESTWSLNRRYFDLTFSGGMSSIVTTTLVGYDALLTPGQYVLGPDEIGYAIASKTKVNGSTPASGYIYVSKKGADYVISAVFPSEGGEENVYYWTGSLPFTPDPAPRPLTTKMFAQKTMSGTVQMYLCDDAIMQGGDGMYLALELASPDGYLHDGEYTASSPETPGVAEEGEFVAGWDNPEWGQYGLNQGTCLFTKEGETTTGEKITDGLVTVSSREEKVNDKDVVIWTIFWGKEYPVQILFEGAIPEITKPKKPVGPVTLDYSYVEDISGYGDGVEKHVFDISDKDDKLVAHIELLMAAEETEYDGEYPSTSYASQPGQMLDGWVWGEMSGGSYYISDAGEKVLMGAGQYTVTVTKIAEGAYNFSSEAFSYDAAGPDYVPGGGDDDEDVTGDVVLKITEGLTCTMTDNTATNTDADKNPLSGVTLWTVAVSDDSGLVANFDLVVAAGSADLEGTYEVMSYPDAVGKAGNGWGMAAWNYFGGCYFKVEGEAYYIPADATITVSNNSDGTLKFKFEGPIQKSDYSDGGTGGVLLNHVEIAS